MSRRPPKIRVPLETHIWTDDDYAICEPYKFAVSPLELNWDNPDEQYVDILRARSSNTIELNHMKVDDPDAFAEIRKFYRHNKIQFIIDNAMTFDPRKVALRQSPLTPFIPFPRQIEAVEWFEDCMAEQENGLLQKSRDSGASWLAMMWALTSWLFEPGFVAGFGSRKEELVDKAGDPKSLFWKMRKGLEYIPKVFIPTGFDARQHSMHMRLINPENGAVLTGEAGYSIGRGDRTTVYFVDESAFLEQPLSIDGSLSATTNCRIDISTSNGSGTPFYAKTMSGDFPVFTFHWRDDPRKDDAWYKKEQRKLDPVILAQEVDIDHHAATSDNWIDGVSIESAMQVDGSKLQPQGPTYLGIDAAHFGDDKSVFTLRQGRMVFWQKEFIHKSGVELANLAVAMADEHPFGVDQISVEMDGPGVSCFDQLKIGRYKDITLGLHTGKQLADGKNFNLRARMYRKAKEWLDDGPVRLPRSQPLQQQLASIPYGYKNGTLLLKSKKEVKAQGFKSPDHADSFALTFAVECNDWHEYEWTPESQDLYKIPEAVSAFDNRRTV